MNITLFNIFLFLKGWLIRRAPTEQGRDKRRYNKMFDFKMLKPSHETIFNNIII